jgi:hypothetical protein
MISNNEIEKKNKPQKNIDQRWFFKLVTWVIGSQASCMEKPQRSIPDKSNIEWWNQKKKLLHMMIWN